MEVKKIMVDVGVLGQKRIEYLDLANKAFASKEYETANNFVDAFLTTISDEDKRLNPLIKTEFDNIEKKRNDTWNKICKETEHLDTWQQDEIRSSQRVSLSLEVLHDKIDACWNICIKKGGLYE